ncbi:hypothetical protein [Haladaptatus cibarius]|uniref:hypothetical protein n=1 Tax=Haladaptatus cibarius TaxID=453847 RepID=UPI00118720EA|nr:hypothetical protein [Haladaptatus cibarius]
MSDERSEARMHLRAGGEEWGHWWCGGSGGAEAVAVSVESATAIDSATTTEPEKQTQTTQPLAKPEIHKTTPANPATTHYDPT